MTGTTLDIDRAVAVWVGEGARADVAREALDYLQSALALGRSELFASYVVWRMGVDRERGEHRRLEAEIAAMEQLADVVDPGVASLFDDTVADARDHLGNGHLSTSGPAFGCGRHGGLANTYLEHLLEGRRREAHDLIMVAVDDGMSIRDLYFEVFTPVLAEVGHRWETNRMSVGQEHYCTAVTQSIMAQLYPYIFSSSPKDRRLVATSVAGNLHEVGIRMVADIFELSGWDTHYLGANTPIDDLLATLRDLRPDAVAISVMLTSQIPAARASIRAVRDDAALDDVVVLVGGHALDLEPELADALGADALAQDPDGAAGLLEELLASR